jgi:hypothetical protein
VKWCNVVFGMDWSDCCIVGWEKGELLELRKGDGKVGKEGDNMVGSGKRTALISDLRAVGIINRDQYSGKISTLGWTP